MPPSPLGQTPAHQNGSARTHVQGRSHDQARRTMGPGLGRQRHGIHRLRAFIQWPAPRAPTSPAHHRLKHSQKSCDAPPCRMTCACAPNEHTTGAPTAPHNSPKARKSRHSGTPSERDRWLNGPSEPPSGCWAIHSGWGSRIQDLLLQIKNTPHSAPPEGAMLAASK